MIRKGAGSAERYSKWGWFEMHAVVSGKSDVGTRQVSLGEVSGEEFRNLMSGQQGSGVRTQAANVTVQWANIKDTHSYIVHSPAPEQHSPSCCFAAATSDNKIGFWSL